MASFILKVMEKGLSSLLQETTKIHATFIVKNACKINPGGPAHQSHATRRLFIGFLSSFITIMFSMSGT